MSSRAVQHAFLSFTPEVLLACFIVVAATGCGDDAVTGKAEAVIDVEEVIDIVTDIIIFETQETQVTNETAVETTVPDGTTETTLADVTPDGQDGCRTFACECNGNSDCLDELCIESADGNVCTRTCVADCPANFDCLSITTFGDPISVCVPRHTRLCRPCRADAECDDPGDPYPAYCLADPDDEPAGATGKFCGSSCANRDCPEGYSCQDAVLSGGGTAKQCVPLSGECTCRPAWGDLGYSTDCAVTNTFGSCDGTLSCTPNGLSPCLGPQATPEICDNADNNCDGQADNLTATPCAVQNGNGSCPGTLGCDKGAPKCLGPEPQAETCNGLDDNCNVSVDENTCNDTLACTTDVCASPNQCQNALVLGNCLINGACFQTGGFNPQNPCEVCDAAKSTASFSQSPNTCVINSQCYPANTTNPENACQICLPGQSTTAWSNANNTCQIGGQCYAANQANPSNACEICSPVSSAMTWTQALNTCNIQGQCFAAGVKDPNNQCVACDPTRSATGWSNAPSTSSCDDANACSAVSFCNGAGACVGDTSCNDGITCTVDTCDSRSGCNNSAVTPGTCRIGGTCYSDNTANPTNPCQRCAPSTNQANWSPQPTTVGCNDNLFCTTDDHCNGSGGCGGTPRTCGDAFSCTADSCNENSDSCVNSLQAGNCLIGNACYANNTTQPNNVCYKCNAGASTSAWSLNNGFSCSDGNECTSTDSCNNGTCSGSYIRDSFESNDVVGTPYNLGSYKDSDNYPQRTETPTISGPGDVDWFTYTIDDVILGDVEPHIRVYSVDPSYNLEICIWFRCTNNNAVPDSLDCPGGGGVSTSSVTYGGAQYNGCCRNAAGNGGEEAIYLEGGEFDCPSADDDFRALVRVRNVNNAWSCNADYKLEIGDD